MTRTYTPGEVADVLESGAYRRSNSYLLRIVASSEGVQEAGNRCCLGVMCDLAGIDDSAIKGRAMLRDLAEANRDKFVATFPWFARSGHELRYSGHLQGDLATANDRMPFDDLTYTAPISFLRAWEKTNEQT